MIPIPDAMLLLVRNTQKPKFPAVFGFAFHIHIHQLASFVLVWFAQYCQLNVDTLILQICGINPNQ